MFDSNILKATFHSVLTNPSSAETFFKEADKAFRFLIPYSRPTSTLYNTYITCCSGNEDLDDIVQDCLEVLWVRITDGSLNNPDKIVGYFISVAKYTLLSKFSDRENDLKIELTDSVPSEDTYGKFTSEELEHIAISYKNKVPHKPYQTEQVSQFTRDYRFVASYPSPTAASKSTGIQTESIQRCCNHNRKSAGGYIWLYSADELCKLMEN